MSLNLFRTLSKISRVLYLYFIPGARSSIKHNEAQTNRPTHKQQCQQNLKINTVLSD